MNIKYNLTGEKRKELVKAISEIVGIPAKYQFMPTCSYTIGEHYTVTKDGTLIIDGDADEKEIQLLLAELADKGYQIPHTESSKLTVQMPRDSLDDRTLNRIRRILENKGELFKAAFQTDTLDFLVTEKTVDFPWFTVKQDGDAKAYTTFISMLCKFAGQQKRINHKLYAGDNPKYAFRCFLLRLGMIGTEFKAARKVLLRELSGSSAFRNGGNENAVSE